MNTKIIGAIAFKLFAIYLFVQIPFIIPAIVGPILAMQKTSIGVHTNWIPIIIVLIVCFITGLVFSVIIWKLGNKLLSQLPGETEKLLDSIQFELVMFQLLGVYFIIDSLFPLASQMTTLLNQSEIIVHEHLKLVGIGLQFLLGIHLVLKVNYWVNLINRVRVSNLKNL